MYCAGESVVPFDLDPRSDESPFWLMMRNSPAVGTKYKMDTWMQEGSRKYPFNIVIRPGLGSSTFYMTIKRNDDIDSLSIILLFLYFPIQHQSFSRKKILLSKPWILIMNMSNNRNLLVSRVSKRAKRSRRRDLILSLPV